MSRMTRSRQVLVYDLDFNGTVHFHNEVDEPDERYRTCLLLVDADWRDMGSPQEITITIEPGGLLNE